MEFFIQVLINGTILGFYYAVMILGFLVIWGVMGVINLAHGEFLMLGAYLTWVMNRIFGWEPFVALLVMMPVMFVLGYIIQRLLINRIIERPHLVALLVTFGLGIIISNAVKLIFSADIRVTETALSGAWHLSEKVTIPVTKFFVMLAAILIMIGLYAFLYATRLGKSIRAAAQNKEAARMVGIEINQIYALTFAICIALTGAAGGLISSTQAVFPFMGAAFHAEGLRHYGYVRVGKYSRRFARWRRVCYG